MDQLKNLGVGKRPSKKLFAILAVAILAAVGIGGYVYNKYSGDANDAPPYLKMDTSSLMQGKLSKLEGFAELKTSSSYSCVGGAESSLEKNVNNVFATKAMTFKEISDSLKFEKEDGQYLIAFFSPGDERAGKGFDAKGWYFYPTSDSPYKTRDDEGVGYDEINIQTTEGANYTIPAYRGFQIIVNNTDTKICGTNLKLSNDKDFIASLGQDVFVNDLKYWPKGWIMIPLGNEFATELKDVKAASQGGLDVSTVFLQTDKSEFTKDFTGDTQTDYLMFWVKLNSPFDWKAGIEALPEEEETPEVIVDPVNENSITITNNSAPVSAKAGGEGVSLMSFTLSTESSTPIEITGLNVTATGDSEFKFTKLQLNSTSFDVPASFSNISMVIRFTPSIMLEANTPVTVVLKADLGEDFVFDGILSATLNTVDSTVEQNGDVTVDVDVVADTEEGAVIVEDTDPISDAEVVEDGTDSVSNDLPADDTTSSDSTTPAGVGASGTDF